MLDDVCFFLKKKKKKKNEKENKSIDIKIGLFVNLLGYFFDNFFF